MKKLSILFLILFTLIISLKAQSISVKSFRPLPNDLTANIEGTQRFDPNTRKNAALIKVVTPETGFYFDGGMSGLVGDPVQKLGEIWVYLPEGAKKITINHKVGVLRDYFFPEGALRSGKTYEMVLITGKVHTIVEEDMGVNYATLIITPKNAEVFIDDKPIPVDAEGVATTLLSYGSHKYKVSAGLYKDEMGVINITNDVTTEKSITLEPNYSILQINSTPSGATIYIDDFAAGTTPLTTKPIEAGEHTFQFKKTMYATKTVTHTINSGGGTQTISETLQPNFSEITITAPNQSEIYVNNEKKGVGSWTGTLNAGSYIVEARKESHRGSKTKIEVLAGTPQTITLEAPTPRYGTLNIQSNPARATVIIDGKELGVTPGFFKNILIGEQEVTLKKDGYAIWTGKVTVEEGKTLPLSATLQNTKLVWFTSTHPNAQLYVDNQYLGSATGEYNLTYGTHNIVCKAQGEKDFTTTINVTQGQEVQTVKSSFTLTNNGHEYVDLGLSVKWATCNVGATTPEGYGDYFAWGETSPKTTYNWSTYKYCNGTNDTMTKYCTDSYYGTVDNKTVLELSDDAASANWGGSWRMPTKAEQDELRDTNNCTWTRTTQNGVNGYKVTSKKNGNSIFLPAAGYRCNSALGRAGKYGFYWSSSLDTSYSSGACYLNFGSDRVDWYGSGRYDGQSVRAVCE